MTATGPPAPSTASAVARFMLGSLAAIAVVVVGGFFALRTVAIHEAERDTRSRVQTLGRLVQSVAITALALVPTVASAENGGDRGVRVAGSCGNGATSKLELKNDDGVIQVEFEVDQNRVGKRWRVTLVRDGNVVFRGHRTTTALSGSFSLERRLRNLPGAIA